MNVTHITREQATPELRARCAVYYGDIDLDAVVRSHLLHYDYCPAQVFRLSGMPGDWFVPLDPPMIERHVGKRARYVPVGEATEAYVEQD